MTLCHIFLSVRVRRIPACRRAGNFPFSIFYFGAGYRDRTGALTLAMLRTTTILISHFTIVPLAVAPWGLSQTASLPVP